MVQAPIILELMFQSTILQWNLEWRFQHK